MKFGPHARSEKEFGVGALPKHEIAQAAVAAGANQQINIERRAAGVSDFAETLGKFALRNFEARKHPAGSAKNGVARGIIHGDAQFEGAAGGSDALGGVDGLREGWRNAITPADDAQANAFGGALGRLRAKIFFEQAEERNDFAEGASPVVGREGVKRERADAERGSSVNGAANGFHSGAMAFGTSEAFCGGPAAIAIEKNGDVELGFGH